MTITVEKDWWKTLFDDLYLQTDARSVCDETLTQREVDAIIEKLNLNQDDYLLDLCGGQGRHSLELSRRGYQHVVLFDYSTALLDHGRRSARRNGLSPAIIQGDARSMGFCNHAFTVVLLMGCSFGYFTEDQENSRILNGIFQCLQPSGRLLIDLPHRAYVRKHFTPRTCHWVDNLKIIRTREIQNNTLFAREEVISPTEGAIRVSHYCTRLYGPDTISELLHACGFVGVHCDPGFMDRSKEGDFGSMTSRMVVTATKP